VKNRSISDRVEYDRPPRITESRSRDKPASQEQAFGGVFGAVVGRRFGVYIDTKMIRTVLLCAFVLCGLLSLGETEASSKIEHVIVLMLENRSFDHMLGFMKGSNSEINGCTTGSDSLCQSPEDPTNASSPIVYADSSAVYHNADPTHSISGTTQQVYGYAGESTDTAAPMSGFIKNYVDRYTFPVVNNSIMSCFAPENVPVITTLASEFALYDGWFASVPGPTMVNRAYSASATSHGMGTNDHTTIALGMPQQTMFTQLEEMGHDWKVYFDIAPTMIMFKELRRAKARKKFTAMDKFYKDAAAGDLPAYSFVEPSYFDSEGHPATDQHPDHDVSAGDELIKKVYDALRAGPLWNKTAFIVTYDEHGGFYDHVSPMTGVPSPDGIDSTDDPFDFTRIGVRIPTIIASPWIPKGTLMPAKGAGEGQYEHSSLPATIVHKLFAPVNDSYSQPDYLTKRDAWAATFEDVFSLDEPRTDCPETMPQPPSHREQNPDLLPPLDGMMEISDLQTELVSIVSGLVGDSSLVPRAVQDWTESDAAFFCAKNMNKFFGRNVVDTRLMKSVNLH
jgi:phospholipase C